jgi:HK97 family phage major capsid protein
MAATWQEKMGEANRLFGEAKVIFENAEASAEDKTKAVKMLADVKALKAEAEQLGEIQKLGAELLIKSAGLNQKQGGRDGWNSLGHQLYHIAQAGNIKYRGQLHPSLKSFTDPDEAAYESKHGQTTWEHGKESKDLAESAGSTGGFLVVGEQRTDLLAVPAPVDGIRERAQVVPMRSRTLKWPTLNQRGTTAGSPHFFGGIEAKWTEEAGEKESTDPAFDELTLTAWKLVCYTRTSDELLADSAVALAAFFSGPMGFAGAIKWEEEYTFLRGSGAGQPMGVINAPGTITVPRQQQLFLNVGDITAMIEASYGDNLVWHISRSQMGNLLQLNGPAGSASPQYVFMPAGLGGVPATLMGYPIIWSDKLPRRFSTGDIVLANWQYYLIGDRQMTTIDSTNVERFRYDQTSWRAVHRVDGQPQLRAPLTYDDGLTSVAPFVVLGQKTT